MPGNGNVDDSMRQVTTTSSSSSPLPSPSSPSASSSPSSSSMRNARRISGGAALTEENPSMDSRNKEEDYEGETEAEREGDESFVLLEKYESCFAQLADEQVVMQSGTELHSDGNVNHNNNYKRKAIAEEHKGENEADTCKDSEVEWKEQQQQQEQQLKLAQLSNGIFGRARKYLKLKSMKQPVLTDNEGIHEGEAHKTSLGGENGTEIEPVDGFLSGRVDELMGEVDELSSQLKYYRACIPRKVQNQIALNHNEVVDPSDDHEHDHGCDSKVNPEENSNANCGKISNGNSEEAKTRNEDLAKSEIESESGRDSGNDNDNDSDEEKLTKKEIQEAKTTMDELNLIISTLQPRLEKTVEEAGTTVANVSHRVSSIIASKANAKAGTQQSDTPQQHVSAGNGKDLEDDCKRENDKENNHTHAPTLLAKKLTSKLFRATT